MDKHFPRLRDRSIGPYFSILVFRFLIYTFMILLSGLLTFLGLEVYGHINPANSTSMAFKGIYAWATAVNFGLSHFIVDIFTARFTGTWGHYEHRTIGKTLGIWFLGFLLFFIIERSLVWKASIIYFPYITEAGISRPSHIESFFFCFPFWLAITFVCLLTMNKVIHRLNIAKKEGKELGYKAIITEEKEKVQGKNAPIFINSGKNQFKVEPEKISHISSEDHYLNIYVTEGQVVKPLFIKMTLKNIQEKLPENGFLHVHRSHIVNLSWVKALERNKNSFALILSDNLSTKVPVSRHRIPDLKPHLSQFL